MSDCRSACAMPCGKKSSMCACASSNQPQLLVTRTAPQWAGKAVVGGEIKDLSSEQYKGKFQVLIFYPMDFTFVCPTELIAFSDRVKEFRDLGAEIIGISTDSEYTHFAWATMPRDKGGLQPIDIPLVADIKKDIARSFGVLYQESVAVRGLFIIDGNNIIRHATINDLPIGRSVDEAIRVIQAIQFTDKHGEVCPANWQPGSKTMKADPKKSLEYFSNPK